MSDAPEYNTPFFEHNPADLTVEVHWCTFQGLIRPSNAQSNKQLTPEWHLARTIHLLLLTALNRERHVRKNMLIISVFTSLIETVLSSLESLSRENVAQHQTVYFKYSTQIITTGLLRTAVVREDGSDLPFLRCSGFGWYKLSGTFHYLLLSVKTDEQILPTWLFCRALRGSVTTGSCVTVENMPAHRALSLVLFFSTYPHTEHTVPGISRHGYLFSSSIYSFLAKPCYNQRSTIALSTENPRPWRRWHVRKRNSSPLETQGTRHHYSASRNVVLGLRSKNQAMGELCTVRPGGLWRLRW